jgi:hypothetical protein
MGYGFPMDPLDACPVCGAEVVAVNEVTGKQRERCGGCRVGLVRFTEAPETGWMVDPSDNSPKQCRARLEALAEKEDFRFEEPFESSPNLWRCYLWVKQAAENRPTEKTARVWGSGVSADDALRKAVSDAQTKSLL